MWGFNLTTDILLVSFLPIRLKNVKEAASSKGKAGESYLDATVSSQNRVPRPLCLCANEFQQLDPHCLPPDKQWKTHKKGDPEPKVMEKKADQNLRKRWWLAIATFLQDVINRPPFHWWGWECKWLIKHIHFQHGGLRSIVAPHSPMASLPNPP